MTESAFLKAHRLVSHDMDLRARARAALIVGGYVAADFEHVLIYVLTSPRDGGPLADLATVDTSGPPLAPVHVCDSEAITDAMLTDALAAAHEHATDYGLPLTRAADGSS